MRRNYVISFFSIFVFFMVVFAIFRIDLMLNICISATIAFLFVIINPILRCIAKIYARNTLRKVKQYTVKTFGITQQEADKLFYLKEGISLNINKEVLKNLKISEESKLMIIFAFEVS